MKSKKILIIATLILGLILSHCSSKKSEDKDITDITDKPKPFKSLKERTMSSDSGIIFGGSKKNEDAPFAANNILWRATLESLNFVPLNSADYGGGVIVTDWYSTPGLNSGSIKITVKFLSANLSSNSIEVDSYERTCNNNSFNCSIKKTSKNFNTQIKDKILAKARELSVKNKK